MRASDVRNTDPPFWVAWHQARASIRVRFWRQAITAAGVALGIAFFSSMQVLQAAEGKGADAAAVSRNQWLVATSLVMCLVGITNSMLMSVTERFREIGTMKCLGASDTFVVKVYFLESLQLGLLGSVVGSVFGAGLMAMATRAMGQPAPPSAVGAVMGFGTVLGLVLTVVAAIFPAIQAARMPAAAALRVEV
ncbi:MAG: FtsX-like permease family protein [Fimbriimonadaceae bacterium]|nr:FtsX-like permease family protein [Fimbriimonadaceae bacterium]